MCRKMKRVLILMSALATMAVGVSLIEIAVVTMANRGITGHLFFSILIGTSVVMTGVNTVLCRRPER